MRGLVPLACPIVEVMRKLLHKGYGTIKSGLPFNTEKRGFNQPLNIFRAASSSQHLIPLWLPTIVPRFYSRPSPPHVRHFQPETGMLLKVRPRPSPLQVGHTLGTGAGGAGLAANSR